jgi:hypothetical protein
MVLAMIKLWKSLNSQLQKKQKTKKLRSCKELYVQRRRPEKFIQIIAIWDFWSQTIF